MKPRQVLCITLVLFVVSGCWTTIGKLHYFAPNPSPGQEVFVPKKFDPKECKNIHYFINTYPPFMARIQHPKITLDIAEYTFRDYGLSFSGPLIFIMPDIFYPLTFRDSNKIVMHIIVRKADTIIWDISKCVVILPDGESIVPEKYWVKGSSPFPTNEILEAHNINTKWKSLWVSIGYPITTKEVESFRLALDGLTADSKNIVLPEMEFQKASVWIGEIDKGPCIWTSDPWEHP